MRPSKARFVTACQQLLAIAAVLAVLGPAANVVSLDVVVTRPGDAAVEAIAEQPTLTRPPGAAERRAPAREERSRVETAPVEPQVTEVPLEPETPAVGGDQPAQAEKPAAAAQREFVSEPEKVEGYGAVGVTWSHDAEVPDDEITLLARTRKDGTWSGWTELEYHDEHGPDPDTREGRKARPGTDPLVIGDVDEVQTKAITQEGVEADDLTMAVVGPGRSAGTEVEAAAIDTAKLSGDDSPVADGAGTLATGEGAIELQAGSYTQKPQIYSRAQWGANERLRDAGSLAYFEVHAGFVHHTVNANDYTRDQVPGIIRSIYAYHTQTRGWSDVGYNFLIDRFGRIWEGRYGGVDRPVVGAHTQGYNDYAFAASAIGNFETAQPTSAMLQSYGRLMAWKLSLHGVSASSTRQKVGPDWFPAINGHRDAGSTACPGRYLYAKLSTIRTIAAQTQADWSGRDRITNLVGTSHPDIVVRRAADSRAFVLPTGGMLSFERGRVTSTGYDRYDVVAASPDLTGDGRADLVVRNASTGSAGVRPGTGTGTFGKVVGLSSLLTGFDQVAAVGDLDRDGRNDVVARHVSTKRLFLFRGDGTGQFRRVLLSEAWAGRALTAGTGDLTGDGIPDVVSRDTAGTLWLHRGTGKVALAAPTRIKGLYAAYDTITGFGDFNADGKADLLARKGSTGVGYLFPGRGNGTFGHWIGPISNLGGLTHLSGVQVTDTRDADVVGLRGSDLVLVQHSGAQNTFPLVSAGTSFPRANLVLNVGDWDRDGPGDVITRNGTGELRLHRGLGSGRFAAPVVIGSGFSSVGLLTAVGDTTGDGWPDLMGQPRSSAMRIYPGRGTGGLRPSYVAHSAVSATRQVGLGRWNKDGAPDNAFRSGDSLSWLAGNGPGGLTGARSTLKVDLSPYDWVLGVGDVNGDARPDLVVRERSSGYLWLLPGGTSGFGARRFLAQGYGKFDLAG